MYESRFSQSVPPALPCPLSTHPSNATPLELSDVDIAGTSRSDKPEGHIAKGATGFGARLLIDWIENHAQR